MSGLEGDTHCGLASSQLEIGGRHIKEVDSVGAYDDFIEEL
jgi:hypothetical protein